MGLKCIFNPTFTHQVKFGFDLLKWILCLDGDQMSAASIY